MAPRLIHGHEMLFGFGGAAIAGFLLTAVATWTRRPLIAGMPLQVLVFVWLLGRLGLFLPNPIGWRIWGTFSVLFWFLFCAFLAREIHVSRNTRNYKVLLLIFALACTDVVFFTGSLEISESCLNAGLFLIINVIMLVAGRIIPAFTNNWLNLNRPELTFRLSSFGTIDLIAVVATNIFAAGFVIQPLGQVTAGLGMMAAVLQVLRILRWRGWVVRQEPLLWILHVGYSWIPIGIGLLAMAGLSSEPRLSGEGIHALTYGAIGTLILGVSARVALGHSGRSLIAFPIIRIAFLLMSVGAIFRVTLPPTLVGMSFSVALWILSMSLFILRYWRILSQPSKVR